ncbi:hypothetical protein IQ07DRAFT_658231 [Pyrenochaeta sp. DS3sAY3a]|nr:hypothetical protein IQ07DRAFT_658231 [Pyrenochaeta sp. DS3sAY3a]
MESNGLIDTPEAMASLLDSLVDLPNQPPPLYIDLEGINLSRHGSISIMQLYILPRLETHLIDIHKLGSAAFTTPSTNGNTLKAILESPTITKAFFDVRNDSDALFSLFNISLAGICDIQLMELATRDFSKRCVKGLAKCMERDLTMTPTERRTWLAGKEAGVKLFAPERGGSYAVFNARPLPEAIRQYCLQDVQFLPRLWKHYSVKLTPSWTIKVDAATKDRVALSQTKSYAPNGPHKALGPW